MRYLGDLVTNQLHQLLFAGAVLAAFSFPFLLTAQEQPPPASMESTQFSTTVATPPDKIMLPAGTRLPLMLQAGITTRTAKPGDAVYFETTFPIAQDNRVVIPMGTFVRGEIVSVERPGRLKGRAELQMRITSLTYRNGYVVSLVANPGSLDDRSNEGIDDGGKIKGPSGAGKDVATVATTTLVGLGVGTYGGLVGGVANGSAHAFGAGVLAGGGAGLLTGLLAVALTRGPDAQLPAGTTLDVVFNHSLALETAHLPPNDPGIAPVPPPTEHAAERFRHRRSHPPIWGLPLN
jgi:hypothetical protein